MTAAPGFALLEAVGWYAERPEDPAREVLVSFGDASLVIQSFDETPIAHWPIGGLVEIRGPAAMTLAPDAEAPERLTLQDRDMIAAIRALRPGGPRAPAGRRRRPPLGQIIALALAALAALLGWRVWPSIPDLLAAQTPPAARAALGDAVVAAYAGAAVCDDPAARRALVALARPLANIPADGPVALSVVDVARTDDALAVAAPGGRVVILRAALRRAEAPETLLRAVAEALVEAEARSPTAAALAAAGVAGLRAALGGSLRAAAVTEAGARLLAAPRPAADEARRARAADLLGPETSRDDALTAAALAALRRGCG